MAQDAVFMQLLGDLVQPIGYGLVGLVAAGVFGAILSSIDSMLNSGATLVTFDLYKRYVNPNASDKKLIAVGRIWVLLFLLLAALLTIFRMDPNSKDSFFLQIASHQSKLIAGVVVAFFLGLLWKGATATGGFLAIVSGVLFSYGIPWLYPMIAGEELVRIFGENLNFMHSVFVAAVLSLILHVVVSRMTRQPNDEKNRAQHTWIGLGIFSRASFSNFATKLCGTLVLFAIFGFLMWREFTSPLVAALVTAAWTWLMFLDATLKTLLSAAAKGRAHSLLREDKFWGGLLAACAVFMLFYFK